VVTNIAALEASATADAAMGPVANKTAAVEPETPAVDTEPPVVKETITRQEAPAKPEGCHKKRFKTNRKGGC
jgi:hypothetical protein